MWLFFQRYRFFFSNPNYDFQSVHRSAYGDFWRRRPSGPCRSKQDVNWLVTKRRWVCTFAVTGLGPRCHGPKLGAQRCRHAWRGMARTMGRASPGLMQVKGSPSRQVPPARMALQSYSGVGGGGKLSLGLFFSFLSKVSSLCWPTFPKTPSAHPQPLSSFLQKVTPQGGVNSSQKTPAMINILLTLLFFFFFNSGMHCLPPNARKCNWLQENWSEDGAPCSALH